MYFVFILTIFLVFPFFVETRRKWVKSDLPQFQPKKMEQNVPTGPRNRIADWRKSLAFEKVSKGSDVFCRIYNLCAHYTLGITVLNTLSTWKERGMIYPYKKWDGKPDPNIPRQKIENFVRTFHNSRAQRNNHL